MNHSKQIKIGNKKVIILIIAIIALLIALIVIVSRNKNNSKNQDSGNEEVVTHYVVTNNQEGNANSYSYYSGNDEVKDWMKDQASGKNYSYDDGGDYYCMGKNDTCPNKTKNMYDLYCDSCDPDGDNIEG